MSRRRAPLLAWTLFAVFVAMVVFTYVELLAGHPSDEWFVVVALGYAVVGALVASRRPENPLGWLLLTISVVLGLGAAAESYALVPGRPGRAWVGWVSSWSWSVWMVLAAVYVPLLFPTGRLLSRRWRPVAWLGAVALSLMVAVTTLQPGYLDPETQLVNPLGVPGARQWLATAELVGNVALASAFVLAAASLAVRLRRSRGVERQQLKWFALVGMVVVTSLVLAMVNVLVPVQSTYLLGAVGWFTFLFASLIGVPVAVGIAILRHGLLDIDVVINRTLVYGSVTMTLLAAYLGAVLLLQLLLRPLTESSDLAVAGSTLAVAALFRPARSAIQHAVDKRFYRSRYDAQRTVEAFAGRLRSQLDLHTVGEDLRGVVAETVQPVNVSVWLRGAP